MPRGPLAGQGPRGTYVGFHMEMIWRGIRCLSALCGAGHLYFYFLCVCVRGGGADVGVRLA